MKYGPLCGATLLPLLDYGVLKSITVGKVPSITLRTATKVLPLCLSD